MATVGSKYPMVAAWMRLAVGVLVALVLVTRVESCQTSPPFGPVTDEHFFHGGHPDSGVVELGRRLFFDEALSGNRNISCATCHHPRFATTDGLSLPVGEGGEGLGPARTTGAGDTRIRQRVARNAPALFNLGAFEFTRLFYDGRIAVDSTAPSGFSTPAGDDLPQGLRSVLAAQALFPLILPTEMAGQPGENAIADAVHGGHLAGAWDLLAQRMRTVPAYVDRFIVAFDDVHAADDVTIVHVANALAAFEAAAFRSDRSPFDRYLRGERDALTDAQRRGMRLFYGEGGRCSRCHAGPFQTDHAFHSIGMPQLGPGTGNGRDDFGRERVTGDPTDRYRFRTPSLRNVALTGPWGHSGAYGTLEAVIEHYRQQGRGLQDYDRRQVTLPSRPDLDETDFAILDDPGRVASIVASSEAMSLPLTQLSAADVADLLAFLESLTDPGARDLRDVVPESVPNGRMTETSPRPARER